MQEIISIIRDDVKLIKELLTGNGNPQKGVIVRLDRVEVAQRKHRWVLMALFTALAGAAATGLVDIIIGVVRSR